MTTIKEIIESNEREFEERYDQYNPIHDDGEKIPVWNGGDYADMKSYLHESQLRLLQGVRETVEGMRKEPEGLQFAELNYDDGYNSALQDIISSLPETNQINTWQIKRTYTKNV